MTIESFTHDGITYKALSSHGAFYGVTMYRDRQWLVAVTMLSNGLPDMQPDGPNAVDVVNFDERQELLDDVNRLLGTSFLMSSFPGR